MCGGGGGGGMSFMNKFSFNLIKFNMMCALGDISYFLILNYIGVMTGKPTLRIWDDCLIFKQINLCCNLELSMLNFINLVLAEAWLIFTASQML